ncbi:autotransporter outer membrane beta-barrel domain-containing protein [Salmonella enterica]|nr:autotransporter outer membrane beta-barrel domain-containing protein [Salmonella enterica]
MSRPVARDYHITNPWRGYRTTADGGLSMPESCSDEHWDCVPAKNLPKNRPKRSGGKNKIMKTIKVLLQSLPLVIPAIYPGTSSADEVITIHEGDTFRIPQPSLPLTLKIMDAVTPTEPTIILGMITGLTVTHEANDVSRTDNTLITNSTIGELTLASGTGTWEGSKTTIDSSGISRLVVSDHNYAEISKNSTIMEVTTGTTDSGGIINNYGNVKEVNNVREIHNNGVIADATMIGLLDNGKNGTVMLSNGASGSHVLKLVNAGKITITNNAILAIKDEMGAKTTITNTGVIELGPGGALLTNIVDTNLTNWGVITEQNRTEAGEFGSIVITAGEQDAGKSTILNHGTINVPAGGIVIENDGDMGRDRTVIIENTGRMYGGIYELDGDGGERKIITIHNNEGGYWESKFDSTELKYTEVRSTYDQVINDGIVVTKKRPDGQAGKIVTNEFSNNGTIDIRNAPLIIDGEYKAGIWGRLLTSGTLGGDETELPTLTVHGSVTGETTHVKVENLGGAGAATTDGILVVRADTVAGGGFSKEGRIVAGAYDYDLVRVESGDHTEWRLTSSLTPEPPGPVPPVPPGPEPGPEPVPPVPPAPVHVVRPEAVTYAENLRQANTLFMTDSEQRRAVGEYTDPVTGRTETSSLWLSQTGGHSARHDASGQLNSDYNRYTVQLGGTLLSLPAGDDGRLEAGVQAGYGHARGNTRSGLTGYRARGTVSGYSTGLYGTWRQHRDGQSGAYISTTLQYSWLKNQVKGDDLAAEKYDARGTTLSLEGGYDYAVWQGGEQNGDSLFIRPHAQVTRMGVKADEHREANGTRVRQQGDGSVFSRTGVRVWLDKAVSKGQRVQPFVETNWLHNTRDFCSSMDGVRDCLAGNRNQAEVLAGVTGDVSRNVAVTAQAGGRFGSQASRDLAGTLNVSVKF